MKESNW